MSSHTEKKVLVTGGAGFIGSHLVERLLAEGNSVVAIDSFCDFYDPSVKRDNVKTALSHSRYRLVEGDIRNVEDLERTFDESPFDVIVHLAAMAGVRPSLQSPSYYMDVNVLGTQRLLDAALKQDQLPRFVFGSSSSVYGERVAETFSETDVITRPVSPYAASKVAGEMICHASHMVSGLNVVALRFFTVFGPRQRPDLAIHKFVKLIESGQPIEVYGDGSTQRDYTFVGDIVNGITAAMFVPCPGFEIFNLGRSAPVRLLDMIHSIENALGMKAKLTFMPMQKGDVPNTFAGIEKARTMLGYEPKTTFDEGISRFVEWHRKHESGTAGNTTGKVMA